MNPAVQKRIKLFSQNPHCNWCGRLTRIISAEERKILNNKLPDDAATLDHLTNVLIKYHSKNSVGNTVLACYKCNFDRGYHDVKNHHCRDLKIKVPDELNQAYENLTQI